jgi:Acetyltransferase (GNAT) domain
MARHKTIEGGNMTGAAPHNDSIPWVNSLFEQPWWLNCVAPGAWDAVEVRRGDAVVARLPYARRRRLGLQTIVQPLFTQTLGPWVAPTEGKPARRADNERALLGQLIEMLPPFDIFRQCCATALTNWLPFYWAGFEAAVRYTYRIEDLTDLDLVQRNFQEHVRRGIRKASKAVEVDHDYPLEELLRLDVKTYERQGMKLPHSHDLFRRLDAECAARGARRIFGAVDAQGRTHAALYIVWDERTCYALVNARDPEFQAFGANTLLYWEAIRLASEVSRVFDFEGSMVKQVEHFVRAFGGRQTPYFCIHKTGLKAHPAMAARQARHALGRLARKRA